MKTITRSIYIVIALGLAVIGCSNEQPPPVQGLFGGGGGFVPGQTNIGDITGVTAGSGLSGGGTNGALTLSVNIAGATCTAGRAMTALSAVGAGTCASVQVNDYAGTHLEWVEEYMPRSGPASGVPLGMWSASPAGASAAVSTGAVGSPTRPGIFDFTTGTTTTGAAIMSTNFSAVDFGGGSWVEQWTGGWPVLSTGAEEYAAIIGYGDTTTVNEVDGCYFLYDRGNVATGGPNTGNSDKLSCWCASNSTRTKFLMDGSTVSDESFTTVDSPVAAATLSPEANIYTLEVRMTGSTRAEFFVNGTKRCNINTNIPSGAARLTGATQKIIKSAGGTARLMYVDRTRVAVDLTAARSP
jgi:hypothetical protein